MVLARSKGYFVDVNEDDEITNNPHDQGFYGSITHWMPLPSPPKITNI